MHIDTTTTSIFGIQPYFFFFVVGIVFASSLFILLLLKYNYSIPRYTKIFFLSAAGLIIGARLFGALTGLYIALADQQQITVSTFVNTGLVFYGGMLGFVLSFLLICRIWNKEIDYGVVDLVAVCIPLFHFWGRLGCFFSGCCHGKESSAAISVLYTNRIAGEIVTVSRIPVQFLEASMNMALFIVLLIMLYKNKLSERLLMIYLPIYAAMRIVLELFRGDTARGVWNGISFSQIVSIIIILSCVLSWIFKNETKESEYGTC